MSISPGYTNAEIQGLVYEYEALPYGQKTKWLAGQCFTRHQFWRWRMAVFEGNLDTGLIPREGSGMTSTPQSRRRISRDDIRERQADEIRQLQARVRELEGTNEALGKAIGLLHQLNEQEPGMSETSEPRDSFGQRTSS